MSSHSKGTRGGKLPEAKSPEGKDKQKSRDPARATAGNSPAFGPRTPQGLQAHPTYVQSHDRVPIPRLQKDIDKYRTSPDQTAEKNRVAHACDSCRNRKTKCSGDRPQCKHCENNGLNCVYKGGKRDRLKKQVGSMSSRLITVSRTLRELSINSSEADRQRIEEILSENALYEEEDPDDPIDLDSPRGTSSSSGRPALFGEHNVSARVGSTEEVDKIHEDFTKDPQSQATGFYGKNSELTWMQRLKFQTAHGTPGEEGRNLPLAGGLRDPSGRPIKTDSAVNTSTYHLDDLKFSASDQVDVSTLPTPQVANHLFTIYLETVHPSFPIISRITFINQYNGLVKEGKSPGPHWLAILNMIFAIAAKHVTLVKPDWNMLGDSHTVYFTRAMGLSRDPGMDLYIDTILQHPDMQSIQVSGLAAFYLLATNQINRSWTINGVAIRYAIGLGLNLRNEAPHMSDHSREIRCRVWWSLCATERILTVMTGRPASYAETECTIPLPLPYEEAFLFNKNQPRDITALRDFWNTDTSSAISTPGSRDSRSRAQTQDIFSPGPQLGPRDMPGVETPVSETLFFYEATKLGTITASILRKLYGPPAIELTWSMTLANISTLSQALYIWLNNLPNEFGFPGGSQDDKWKRQRVHLGFAYHSAQMLVHRPCLCRIDRRIPHESDRARQSNQDNAVACVNAAMSIVSLLPDEPNTSLLFNTVPWWNIIHYLMQASTVLMLELSFRGEHTPGNVEEIYDTVKIVLRWLKSIGMLDHAGYRAWRMCDEMLRNVAPKVGLVLEEPAVDRRLQDPIAWNMQNPNLDPQDFGLPPPIDGFRPFYAAYDNNFGPPSQLLGLHDQQASTNPFLDGSTNPFLAEEYDTPTNQDQDMSGDPGYFSHYQN